MGETASLTREEIAARLSGPPEERAAFLLRLAEEGVADAQALFGQLLLDGNGVARDERAAFHWFERAARQHHAMALNMVGRCYDLGWGVAVDKARAAECFRVAAARGLPEAQYNYATALALGVGVAEDKPAALALFEQAAAAGYAKAINHVGSFAEDGWVAPRDMAKAADCYARAAGGGDFRGCFNHARMLAEAGDLEEALAWLRRAGELGNERFVAKALAWLAASDVPGFATRGVAALKEGAGC
ncbi:sel1 repeat family protein [Sphingomonas sp. CL5.1]|uniref:tetratricopeptide repeat protein n=1 Tax=Sphingomonas sp. CL5.1 TaxID=2653203 RepID=UPI0015814A46|nr:tetratricopeptide repeat protein [Sphingomonas sp. CL5.1]QKR98800.1 sel1 repeat family protein [Sphingomonas sp. CL5.1]